ncbi:MAG: nucleotide sugar dehydrogenase [Sandaracinus sp.]
MNIAIVGAGYVGCVSAACLARLGHRVTLVDTDAFKVSEIRAGRSPILEPGLEELVHAMVGEGRLTATHDLDAVAIEAEVAVVCVSTPSLKSGGVDTRPLQRVLASLGRAVEPRPAPLVVVVRSTVAPNRLRGLFGALPAPAQSKLRLVANPEFLRETTAIADFDRPPFVVVGGADAEAVDRVVAMYGGVDAPVHRTDLETAMMVKYASNAYHALKIAFANEVGAVAREIGADPLRVMQLFGEDRILNVSTAYLRPGFAFGGSCLPKDVRALVALGREQGDPLPLLRGVLESNQLRIERAADAVATSGARRIAMLGLTFKRGTDDVRESPYVLLTEMLVGRGIEVKIFDPDLDPARLVGANRQYLAEHLPGLGSMVAPSLADAEQGAEAVVLCKRVASREELEALRARTARWFDLEHVLR